MVGFTTALALSAGATAAGGIYSASQQAKAAKRSAQATQNANDQNMAEQRRQNDQTRQDWLPFQQSDLARRQMADRSYGIQTPAQGGQAYYTGNEGQIDYGSYVRNTPDLMADFERSGGRFGSIEDYGARHWQMHGQGEGRQLPVFQSQAQQQPAGQQSGQPFDPLADFNASADAKILNYQPILDETNAYFSSKGSGLDGAALKAVRDRSTNYTRNAFLDWRGGLEGSPSGANNAMSNAGQTMVNNNANSRNSTANALSSSYAQRANANSNMAGSIISAGNWFANQSGAFNAKPSGSAPRGFM